MARQTIKRIAKVCFDILIFCFVWFCEYAIHKWFKPYRRGFFCGDESLSYPYHDHTIDVPTLLTAIAIVPPVVMIVVELFKRLEPYRISHLALKRKSTTSNATSGDSSSSSYHIGYRLLQCYKHVGYYLFGLGLIFSATEIPKFTIGRLRPYFFTVCQPQLLDGTTCNDDVNQGRYITNYTCLGRNFSSGILYQVNQSFPSGHSSLSVYAMLYLCIYLQAKLSTRASKLLKHLLQFVFIIFAIYCSLTRVSDYWHHWSDVLTGMILGAIVAIVCALYVTDIFERRVRFISAFKTHVPRATAHSTASTSGAAAAATTLPAYTFGTMPYVHYTPHHAQYSHATYQNYGYVP